MLLMGRGGVEVLRRWVVSGGKDDDELVGNIKIVTRLDCEWIGCSAEETG
jgi:hypothetical protein